MGDQAQLLPGTLDLLILRAVSLGPLHGYGVLLRIGQISGNALLIEQGALYPGLFRLVRQGLLKASWGTSENNRRAKFYELTAAGRKRLREETDNWNRLATAIGSALGCATGGSMRLLDISSLRFAQSLPSFPIGMRRWRTSFARTSSIARTIWSARALVARRRSGGRASSSAATSDTGRSRMKRRAGSFSRRSCQDVRFSVRMLRKSPGFTIAAVFTLALAIGANAVVFAVMNALILRPLRVPQPQSLYAIQRGSDQAINHSYPDYLDLRDRNRSFDGLAAYGLAAVGLNTGNNPTPAWVYEVTGNYFDALDVHPYLGRFFHASDEHGPNSAPYIVLPYAYWQSRFEGDRGVVGRVVQLNKHPFTILGVAPPEFRGTLAFLYPDFWVPIVDQEQLEGTYVLDARGNRNILMVLGHLKAGVTPAQAVADLNSVGSYLEKTYPKDDGHMTFSLARPGLAGDWFGRPLEGIS